jgi:hypothetical protein
VCQLKTLFRGKAYCFERENGQLLPMITLSGGQRVLAKIPCDEGKNRQE